MWQRIMVATDGTAHALQAEHAGAEIARRFEAELVLVHAVIEQPTDEEFDGMARVLQEVHPQLAAPLHPDKLARQVAEATGEQHLQSHAEAVRAFGDHLLERASTRARERGVGSIETRLVYGKPANAILDVARQEDADLIVVGTRGMGGLRGHLVGSVAERVTRNASQSSLVVKQ